MFGFKFRRKKPKLEYMKSNEDAERKKPEVIELDKDGNPINPEEAEKKELGPLTQEEIGEAIKNIEKIYNLPEYKRKRFVEKLKLRLKKIRDVAITVGGTVFTVGSLSYATLGVLDGATAANSPTLAAMSMIALGLGAGSMVGTAYHAFKSSEKWRKGKDKIEEPKEYYEAAKFQLTKMKEELEELKGKDPNNPEVVKRSKELRQRVEEITERLKGRLGKHYNKEHIPHGDYQALPYEPQHHEPRHVSIDENGNVVDSLGNRIDYSSE